MPSADVNADDDAVTARGMLFAGAWRGEDATVRRLVSSGAAPVNARDENGVTALRFTAQYGHKELTDFLLENGADPNVQDKDGASPLHLAVDNCWMTNKLE